MTASQNIPNEIETFINKTNKKTKQNKFSARKQYIRAFVFIFYFDDVIKKKTIKMKVNFLYWLKIKPQFFY